MYLFVCLFPCRFFCVFLYLDDCVSVGPFHISVAVLSNVCPCFNFIRLYYSGSPDGRYSPPKIEYLAVSSLNFSHLAENTVTLTPIFLLIFFILFIIQDLILGNGGESL